MPSLERVADLAEISVLLCHKEGITPLVDKALLKDIVHSGDALRAVHRGLAGIPSGDSHLCGQANSPQANASVAQAFERIAAATDSRSGAEAATQQVFFVKHADTEPPPPLDFATRGALTQLCNAFVEIHWINWTAASASATVDCTEQHAPLLDLERFHNIHLHNVINDRCYY